MADYLVRAKTRGDLAPLRRLLDRGEIAAMKPFGRALDRSLRNARTDPDGWAVWEENDYCSPPLAMERAAVLDNYFTGISVERVSKGTGWAQIENLPSLWKANH